jgi:hypothetical protein
VNKRVSYKEDFVAHLKFLFSLSKNTRYKRRDYKEMVNFLTTKGHWKGLPRGDDSALRQINRQK